MQSDIDHPTAPGDISNYDAKEKVARQMAERLRDGDVVGVGSGSTSMLALNALVDQAQSQRMDLLRHHDVARDRDRLRRTRGETSSLLARTPGLVI